VRWSARSNQASRCAPSAYAAVAAEPERIASATPWVTPHLKADSTAPLGLGGTAEMPSPPLTDRHPATYPSLKALSGICLYALASDVFLADGHPVAARHRVVGRRELRKHGPRMRHSRRLVTIALAGPFTFRAAFRMHELADILPFSPLSQSTVHLDVFVDHCSQFRNAVNHAATAARLAAIEARTE
jgi:hypothetical protein